MATALSSQLAAPMKRDDVCGGPNSRSHPGPLDDERRQAKQDLDHTTS